MLAYLSRQSLLLVIGISISLTCSADELFFLKEQNASTFDSVPETGDSSAFVFKLNPDSFQTQNSYLQDTTSANHAATPAFESSGEFVSMNASSLRLSKIIFAKEGFSVSHFLDTKQHQDDISIPQNSDETSLGVLVSHGTEDKTGIYAEASMTYKSVNNNTFSSSRSEQKVVLLGFGLNDKISVYGRYQKQSEDLVSDKKIVKRFVSESAGLGARYHWRMNLVSYIEAKFDDGKNNTVIEPDDESLSIGVRFSM